MNNVIACDPFVRLFDNFLEPTVSSHRRVSSNTAGWLPAVDLKEEEKQYLVKVDLPGVKPDQIEITVDKNVLTLKGEKKFEGTEEEKDNYRRVERRYGKFQRSITLPNDADLENISAKSQDGVLDISLIKSAKAQPRKVNVVY